jgi:TM2 domain-containing membrane protein YozV
MTDQQPTVVRLEKSMLVAYLLLIFLGQLGVHRFYLNRPGTAIAQAILGIVGWMTSWLGVGYILLGILGIWLFVDLFLTAGMVREANGEKG